MKISGLKRIKQNYKFSDNAWVAGFEFLCLNPSYELIHAQITDVENNNNISYRCWLEKNDIVYDLFYKTNICKNDFYNRYGGKDNIKELKRYKKHEAIAYAIETDYIGAWTVNGDEIDVEKACGKHGILYQVK